MLTSEEIYEYQNISEKVLWVRPSYGEALEAGTKIIVFLETIFKK